MDGGLTYNSNDLQTYDPDTKVGIITSSIEHTDIPEKIAKLYVKANSNGSAISNIDYPNKIVRIAGSIVGSSQANLDSRIDTFKGYFISQDENLDINYGSSVRRYIATANTTSIKRQQKALWAEFAIEFICTQPFGVETSDTTITNSANYTSASLTATPTIGGTAPVQYPVITLTYDAVSGGTDYLMISNDNNGQAMLISGQGLVNGDVIEIDCFARTVKLNGDIIDYTGVFLELEPGANSITYSDGYSSRTVDISIVYAKRYL